MSNEAKSVRAWDLADPKSMRLLFTPDSFYIVIDGVLHQTVRHAATTIKDALARFHGIRVRGPLALPTVRRRRVVLREAKTKDAKSVQLANAKRIRNVLLVVNPTSEAVASLISLPMPSTVNIKVESCHDQYELKGGY
ncbi:hypothetical protein EGJ28_22020 [Stutzerimonas xanthomarina]|jgi:ribosomal protein S10|uniref:Small ribosomal subunit protein uS10 domain-containing protein n=2 Tax=Stutzerimonas TaxID=2901164 RepID=A0AA40V7F4_STUST|nr:MULTISPECIES: 30S ribosomal protein S10 [Stutzerimonas]KIL03058.1 30S ribosomal protein [Stutzerimonas stutzeri]MBA1306713.1 hypothetical protein [Stutzerimonas stutzeri]MBK3919816.1 hypothetical protein [Stutzerimonas frequens]RRV04697.1 hypothetical protein EGJ28_22020 [Stutzerimonas xanthomarina]